jgi:hypothetical protein
LYGSDGRKAARSRQQGAVSLRIWVDHNNQSP